jgi:malonyl CoA-acyl carrier protein transacylase
VLSGVTYEIDRAQDLLSQEEVRIKRLPVAVAFHSSLVAQAAAPFAESLTSIEISESTVPVYANATAAAYPDRSADARELLASQMTSSVDFVGCVRSMFADGVRTFVEIGPGRRLVGLIDEILADEDIHTVAIDASTGQRAGLVDLARTLAQLAAVGYPVALERWDEGALEAWRQELDRKAPAMTVKISGANHVDERPKRAPREPVAAPTPVAASAQTLAPAHAVGGTHSPAQDPSALADAMRANEASLAAIVRLQEQTALVHQQFLESQERTLQAIIRQQQGLEPLAPTTQITESVPVTRSIPIVEPVSPTVATPAVEPALVTTPAPATALAAESATDSEVASVLLSVVSEKTGYPEEMLNLSMGLDADLGIDSIKRVEILSALQERLPEAPAISPERLGEIQTLGQIVDFLGGASDAARHDVPNGTPDAETRDAPAPQNGGASDISRVLLDVVADKTGYPVDMLDLSMNLDADLGIDSIKRVEILSALQGALPEAPVVAPDRLGELRTLKEIVDLLSNGADSSASSSEGPSAPSPSQPTVQTATVEQDQSPVLEGVERLVPTLQSIDGSGEPIDLPAGSKIWVTKSGNVLSGQIVDELSAQGFSAEEVELTEDGHNPPDELAGLIVVVPPRVTDEDILFGFNRVRAMAPVLRRAALQGGALLCSVTALGGGFALDAPPPEDVDPTGGAWGGMLKTVAAEWTDVNCRTIDIDPTSEGLAAQVVQYALSRGPVEIGLGPAGPRTVVLEPQPVESSTSPALGPEDVVVITGGARGVTAEVAVAMAEAGQPRLILMGRSPEPTAEPDWLINLEGEAEIKRAILTKAGPEISLQEVQTGYDRIQASREIARTLARIAAAGSDVEYCSVDVRASDAVRDCLVPLVEKHGPVTALVHGAGVLADRNIEDKSDEDFARVYDTKVGGFRSVLAALEESPLKVMVLFSSSTARFGRRGQADYAAANEVLNKVAQAEAARRNACRVVSINWGPWDGGMVTPALKSMFSGEGIEVIGMNSGAAYLLDEIATPDGPAEVLVLGRGSTVPAVVGVATLAASGSGAVTNGASAPSKTTEISAFDLNGADRNGADLNGAKLSGNGAKAEGLDELPTVFERTISTDTHEFMASHVLGGRAVLPAAMTLEWLAHGALHRNPGLRFIGVDDLRVFKGVLLEPDESRRIRVCVDKATKRGDEFLVTAELCSGDKNGGRVLHARADIVLASTRPDAAAVEVSEGLPALGQSIETIYAETLFHGPAMRGLVDVESCGDDGLVARCRVAPPPKDWMHEPVRNRWIADPLVVDSGLQAMIVWTSDRVGKASLPSRWARYRQFVQEFPEGGARIVISVHGRTNGKVVSDIDWVGDDGRLLARLEGYESVVDASLSEAFRHNSLAESVPPKA